MKTPREYQQQQKNDDNRDRHMFDDELINDEVINNEQKSHLHQNYRHWGWLPKPH